MESHILFEITNIGLICYIRNILTTEKLDNNKFKVQKKTTALYWDFFKNHLSRSLKRGKVI